MRDRLIEIIKSKSCDSIAYTECMKKTSADCEQMCRRIPIELEDCEKLADHLLANGVVVLHNRDIHDAFSNIIWYDALYCWLEELADALEKATGYYVNPFSTEKWHTEEHFIWMLLVGMFGDWGTSIRGGWIEQTKECAEYIRWLCSKAKEGAE